MHTIKWFENRIGKRIYRDSDGCDCPVCKDVVKNGLIISDKNHAEYIYNIQMDFKFDGVDLNYRDKQ